MECVVAKKSGYIPAFVKAKILANKISKQAPKSKPGKVTYPDSYSEFEIQSFLHTALREKGYDARGEVRTTTGKSRFDIVIFEQKKAVRIIEIKKGKVGGHTKKKHEQSQLLAQELQIEKYRQHGLPVHHILGMDAAVEYVAGMPDLEAPAVRQRRVVAEMFTSQCCIA
jgi:response regulator RpfG family c-di-GMP phosphodiesterase